MHELEDVGDEEVELGEVYGLGADAEWEGRVWGAEEKWIVCACSFTFTYCQLGCVRTRMTLTTIIMPRYSPSPLTIPNNEGTFLRNSSM